MTVHQAIDHPWLREEHSELDRRIPASRYNDVRDKIHEKYVCKVVDSCLQTSSLKTSNRLQPQTG